MTAKQLPKSGLRLAKIVLGGTVLLGLGALTMTHAKTETLPVVENVQIDRYLGVWYEQARKPLSFQEKCDRDVTATYTLNENGNIKVDNRCIKKDGSQTGSVGEAFVQNEPHNSKLKVTFLPEIIRWLPVGRGDYWILKLDENYQTVLVGEPKRKYLWVLSREQKLDETKLSQYLDYAKSVGYNLDDLIYTKQTAK